MQLSKALDVNPVWLLTGAGLMESVPTYASATKIRDFESKTISVTWPFDTIKPSEYWALPEAQRRIIEQTVATLIGAFHHERGKLQK